MREEEKYHMFADEYVEGLEKANKELKAEKKNNKSKLLDLIKVQGENLNDDYMAGLYNGMVVAYNSFFLNKDETELNMCKKNESGKWESKNE